MLVEDRSYSLSKESILNYQRKLIQSPFQSLPTPSFQKYSKYQICQLNHKINQLIGDQAHNLRWIGNSNKAQIQAYIYCLLMLSVSNSHSLIMFKNIFYQLSRKYVDVKQQKLLIEFLCLLQFSKDKYLFLKKYPIIEEIIFSILDNLRNQSNFEIQQQQEWESQHDQSKGNLNFRHEISRNQGTLKTLNRKMNTDQLVQIYSKFTKKFNYINFNKSSDSSFTLQIQKDQKMHIIVQNQYYFIIQLLKKTQTRLSQVNLSQIKPENINKITLQGLLKTSEDQLQMSLQQKLKFLSKQTEKCSKTRPNDFPKKNSQSPNSFTKKQKISNFKPHFIGEITKNIKSPITKNSVFKTTEDYKPERNTKQDQESKSYYIDQMQSSSEERQYVPPSNTDNYGKVDQTINHVFYKPKYVPKPMISVPAEINKRKNISPGKVKHIQIFERTGSPSQAQKNVLLFGNGDAKQIQVNTKQIQVNTKQIQFNTKQIKLYSPPRFLKESLDRKESNRDKTQIQNKDEFFQKQKKKEELEALDKQYFFKKQEIQHKNRILNDGKNQQKKANPKLFSNAKPFNNRLSLQNKIDLQFAPVQNLSLNDIDRNKKTQRNKRNAVIKSHQQVTSGQNQPRQQLHSIKIIQLNLQKRISDPKVNKFTSQNKQELKKNQSLEQKDTKKLSGSLRFIKKKTLTNENSNDLPQCPQNAWQSQMNGGFQIKITYVQSNRN